MVTPIFGLTVLELVTIGSIALAIIRVAFKFSSEITKTKQDLSVLGEDIKKDMSKIEARLNGVEQQQNRTEVQEGVILVKLELIQRQYDIISSRLETLINRAIGANKDV